MKQNPVCLNARTGEMILWRVNGETFTRPCDSFWCDKHGCIKPMGYALALRTQIERWPFGYFVTLPIGKLLQQPDFSKVWTSFYNRLYYLLKNQQRGYAFFKTMKEKNFHLHGIITSDRPVNCRDVCIAWRDALWDKLRISRPLKKTYCDDVNDPAGAANYVAQNLKDRKGIWLPPRFLFRRLVNASRGFLNQQKTG